MTYRNIGQNVNIPLFKYYGNVDYAKDAIENKRIHLEPPKSYNDIYDSSFTLTADGLKRIHYGNFLKNSTFKKYYDFLENPEIEALIKKDLTIGDLIDYLCIINETLDKDAFVQDSLIYFKHGKKILQSDNNKISCFSEVNDSLLMWAYYAKNYEGVCLRFNAVKDNILSRYCRKVQYTNHYISDNSFGNYFRKSIQWSHEQEWRIVCDTDQEYIPTDSIDAIYLGIRMDDTLVEEFVKLGEKYNLEVYKMSVSDTRYEIIFDKIL